MSGQCHTVNISWDYADDSRWKPEISADDRHVYIGGLQFRYSCEPNLSEPEKKLCKIFLELVDNAVEDFDDNWVVRIKDVRLEGIYKFSSTARRIHVYYYIKENVTKRIDQWSLIELDAHAFRKNFTDEQLAKSYGNEFRVEVTDADGSTSIIWVNRELLAADSSYFQELLTIDENVSHLKLFEISPMDFLEYVYCVHPPFLNLTSSRISRIIKMADKFNNQELLGKCKVFLTSFRSEKPTLLCEHLVQVEHLGMQEDFERTLRKMDLSVLKALDMESVVKFSSKNVSLILKRLTKDLSLFQSCDAALCKTLMLPFILLYYILCYPFTFLLPKHAKFDQSTASYLLNIEAARAKHYDCTILVQGQESQPIYVKKTLLAMNSDYFKALFFGDFVEAGKDTITLKDVTFDDFLEYLVSVYSGAPLTMSRVGVVLWMADHYRNELLIKHCSDFLLHKTEKTPTEKLDTLCLADRYNLQKIFDLTLAETDSDDLRGIDEEAFAKLRPENLIKFLKHCIKCLP